MKAWEAFLRVRDWESGYRAVANVLKHYQRKLSSERTKKNVCEVLASFCKFTKLGPDELVKLSKGEASERVQEFVDSLAQKGLSIRSVNVALAYLKTFFKVNGFKGARELEVERYHQPSRYRKRAEYVPTPDEIRRMAYSSGSARNKAMILALYTSGLRNSTIRALRYGDVKEELEKGLKIVKLPVYPGMKKLVPDACKGNIPYYSFLSKEAVQALREYLAERARECGGVADDEPLFASTSRNLPAEVRRRTIVKMRTLDELVKRAAKRAGVERWREVMPHCLRKAFESALRNNRLDPKDQEFLMGHILPGSQDAYYDSSKVEDLRAKYASVEFFPSEGLPAEEMRRKQVLDTMKILGFPEEKIRRVEEVLAKYRSVDEAMDEIRKISANPHKRREERKYEAKLIDESELLSHVEDGWDIIRELSDGRLVIRKPLN